MIPSELKKLFNKGINIIKYLKEKENILTSDEIIEISYDLQAGSYTKNLLNNEELEQFYIDYTNELSKEIKVLCTPYSIMEAGIGEASTFANTLDNFANIKSYGFDISFSRLLFAKQYLKMKGHGTVELSTGNLYDIPFLDNSIDIVYTSHTIEPNGGNEVKILKELYRVTNKYLILLEPAYELSNNLIKERMDYHGYCKNLKKHAESLGYKIIKYKLFKYSANEQNPTAIIIIEKNNIEKNNIECPLACPKFKTQIYKNEHYLYSDDSLYVYPRIKDINLLRKENAILATNFDDSGACYKSCI